MRFFAFYKIYVNKSNLVSILRKKRCYRYLKVLSTNWLKLPTCEQKLTPLFWRLSAYLDLVPEFKHVSLAFIRFLFTQKTAMRLRKYALSSMFESKFDLKV